MRHERHGVGTARNQVSARTPESTTDDYQPDDYQLRSANVPTVGGLPLDTLRLFACVLAAGGYDRLCRLGSAAWQRVACAAGVPEPVLDVRAWAPRIVRGHYERLLLRYERAWSLLYRTGPA